MEQVALLDDSNLSRYLKLIEHEVIGDTREIWDAHLNSMNKCAFLCHVVIRTIDACLRKEYTVFDAHTTSNCCHGMSLLVCDLISSTLKLDLAEVRKICDEKLLELKKGQDFNAFWIPQQVLALSSLYVLGYVRDIDGQKRMRTNPRKLKTIGAIGTTFCQDIVNELKKHFSNIVAHSYQLYLQEVHPMANINGTPIRMWGSYVDEESLRIDKRGIHYAPCIYSTQISLAYLISSRAKVALVNDVVNSAGEFIDRYICLFEGDGHSRLRPLSQEELLRVSNDHEPVVVFGGYACSDSIDMRTLEECLEPWLEHFPRLMLASDLFYPQFPQAKDDPDFNYAPIFPKEESIASLFVSHTKVPGVSVLDPSLYCSSHIYPASLSQLLTAVTEKHEFALPSCFTNLQIPESEIWGIELASKKSS